MGVEGELGVFEGELLGEPGSVACVVVRWGDRTHRWGERFELRPKGGEPIEVRCARATLVGADVAQVEGPWESVRDHPLALPFGGVAPGDAPLALRGQVLRSGAPIAIRGEVVAWYDERGGFRDAASRAPKVIEARVVAAGPDPLAALRMTGPGPGLAHAPIAGQSLRALHPLGPWPRRIGALGLLLLVSAVAAAALRWPLAAFVLTGGAVATLGSAAVIRARRDWLPPFAGTEELQPTEPTWLLAVMAVSAIFLGSCGVAVADAAWTGALLFAFGVAAYSAGLAWVLHRAERAPIGTLRGLLRGLRRGPVREGRATHLGVLQATSGPLRREQFILGSPASVGQQLARFSDVDWWRPRFSFPHRLVVRIEGTDIVVRRARWHADDAVARDEGQGSLTIFHQATTGQPVLLGGRYLTKGDELTLEEPVLFAADDPLASARAYLLRHYGTLVFLLGAPALLVAHALTH